MKIREILSELKLSIIDLYQVRYLNFLIIQKKYIY